MCSTLTGQRERTGIHPEQCSSGACQIAYNEELRLNWAAFGRVALSSYRLFVAGALSPPKKREVLQKIDMDTFDATSSDEDACSAKPPQAEVYVSRQCLSSHDAPCAGETEVHVRPFLISLAKVDVRRQRKSSHEAAPGVPSADTACP